MQHFAGAFLVSHCSDASRRLRTRAYSAPSGVSSWVARCPQQQEERTICFVPSGGPAAFRTPHDDVPVGRAHAPLPRPTAFFQEHCISWKKIRHFRLTTPSALCLAFDVQKTKSVKSGKLRVLFLQCCGGILLWLWGYRPANYLKLEAPGGRHAFSILR